MTLIRVCLIAIAILQVCSGEATNRRGILPGLSLPRLRRSPLSPTFTTAALKTPKRPRQQDHQLQQTQQQQISSSPSPPSPSSPSSSSSPALPPRLADIATIVDHAHVSTLCYYSIHDIIKNLSKTKHNIRVTQRKVHSEGASYCIIQYTHEREDRDVHRIVAIAGSRNAKNWNQNVDMNLESDDFLKSNNLLDRAHRGYLTVSRAIMADFLSEEKRLNDLALGIDPALADNNSSSPSAVTSYSATSSRNISAVPPALSKSIAITGHSLGGAVACLLALRLKGHGYNIEQVTIFGSPKFTDKRGAEQIAQSGLTISRFEHVLDPAVFSPMALPQPEKIALGVTMGRNILGGLAGSVVGSLAGIAMTDVYADLHENTLVLLEPMTPVPPPASESSTGGDKTASNGDLLPPVAFVGGALSMLVGSGGAEGDGVTRGPHRVYAGKDTVSRSQVIPRLRDLPAVDWRWHSMHSYHDLLQQLRDKYYLLSYHDQERGRERDALSRLREGQGEGQEQGQGQGQPADQQQP